MGISWVNRNVSIKSALEKIVANRCTKAPTYKEQKKTTFDDNVVLVF